MKSVIPTLFLTLMVILMASCTDQPKHDFSSIEFAADEFLIKVTNH